MSALSYQGPVDLVLRYGEVPGLSRTVERQGVALGVSRPAPGQPVMVLFGRELNLDLAKAPTWARLELPDGTVIAGRVSQADCHFDTFMVIS